MTGSADDQIATFLVEMKKGEKLLRLSWPRDMYYGLVQQPVRIVCVDASELNRLAQLTPGRLDEARLAVQTAWFTDASAGKRTDWPGLPVLTLTSEGLEFVDGRHRCAALTALGAERIPVLVG